MRSNEGREFAIAFPPTFDWGTTGTCQLVATSRFSGSLNVTYQGSRQTHGVTPSMRTVIDLPATLRPTSSDVIYSAVIVTSDVDIILYAFNFVYPTGTSGGQQSGYLLYPSLLGMFVILTYNNCNCVKVANGNDLAACKGG